MTDRELLELAAKAAGLEYHWVKVEGGQLMQASEPGSNSEESWNPFADDGDAQRLAVRLGISIGSPDPEKLIFPHSREVDYRQEGAAMASIRGDGYRYLAPHLKNWYCRVRWVSMLEFEQVRSCKDADLLQFWRDNSPEKFENAYTATRRAITRAAAEIGKAMT